MPKKKDEKTVTVVAESEVSSGGKTETIRMFDAAWRRALELPTPVSVTFKRWARID